MADMGTVAFSKGKPEWLKVRAPGGGRYASIKQTLRGLDLHTVCEEARCPNVGECWGAGTATVMLLGHTCTRGCRFCAVTTGNPMGAVDPREPEHVARAIERMGLDYVVLTMVDRDDLVDGGARHVFDTVQALRRRMPSLLIEALTGDFSGRTRDVAEVVQSGLDVFAHNIEVVRRLTPTIRDKRCSYDRSLGVLADAKAARPEGMTKSSIMVGIGEDDEEVHATMADLRAVGVDVVTVGQYLRPTARHAAVERYVDPETFAAYEQAGREMGFAFVASGPLVRSSYRAAEGFIAARLDRPPRTGGPREASNLSGETQGAVDGTLIAPAALVRR
jgi:lipoyl synthase